MSLIADIHRDLEKGALQLLVEYRDRLLSEALKLCGDAARAEDLVFLTIERVLAKSDSYRTDENLFGWMKTIMENLYLNEEKRPDNRRVKIVDPNELEGLSGLDFSAEERILRNSDGEAVRAALGKLDPKDREILVMRFYEDLTLEQIAACLNCPTTSVWRRIQVAIKLLSGKLNAEVKAKKPLAILAAFLLAGSLFGAVTWGIVEVANAVGSLGSEVALESEEPEAALESEGILGSLESEGTLGSLESEGSLGSVAEPVDPNPDPIVPNDTTVPSPLSATGADTTGADTLSTTENTNTKEEETMNLKSITQTAAKLAVGAMLTAGLAANANAGWQYLAKGEEGNPYDYGIVTDGNWVIKVASKAATYFTTASGSGQFTAGSGKLDVVQMESDLGIEWRLGGNATSVDYQKFKGVTAFTEVVLPARITTFYNETFAGCTNLTRFDAPGVTLLSNSGYFDGCTSLTTLSENFIHPNGNIGQTVFNNCSSLVADFVCGPNVSSLGWHAFYKSGITSIDMSKAKVSSIGNSFNDCPNLDKVILSTNCTAISGETCLVNPTQVYATGACLANVAWHSLGDTNYRVRFFVDPVMEPTWNGSTIAGAAVKAVTDADRASSYYTEYGLADLEDAGRLLGVWAPGSGGKIWLIKYQSPYNPSQAERGSLVVATEPEGVGTASPAVNNPYTRFSLDDGARQTCTASANAVKDSDAYKLNGYRLEKWVDDAWSEITTSTDTSYEYVQGDDTFRIVWLYGKDGYTVTVDANLPGSGTATRSPEPAGGLYFEGDEVTVTATAAEGYTFLEWRGDVPEGCDPTSPLISFVVHHGVALTPVFVRDDGWVYVAKGDEGNPYDYDIVTDGNWVIKVASKTATYFTTSSGEGQFAAGLGKLDVVQMESDLGIEWRIGDNANNVGFQKFKGVTAFTEVVLPARITSFSNETFAGCTNLTRFDAPGVTLLSNSGYFDGCTSLMTLSENFICPNGNIGQTVFNNCSSLAADFVCGPNVSSLGYHAFYKSGIMSIDMSKAKVSSIGNSFNDCPNLDKVILSTNCTAISGETCLVNPTQIYATGACLTSVAWHSLGVTDYRVCLFVDPVMDPAWKGSTIAGAAVKAVTDADRASSYYTEYGLADLEKAKRILGVWAPGSGGKIWLIKWTSPYRKVGMKLIFR